MKILPAIVILVACGCSKPAAKSSGDTAAAKISDPTAAAKVANATTTAAKADAALAVTELKFYQAHKLVMTLHPDGRLETLKYTSETTEEWQDVGTFAADGTFASKGDKQGQLQADGTFKGPDGVFGEFKLDNDALVVGEQRETLDEKGVLVMNGKPAEEVMRVEGASDARTRRTALLVIGLMMVARPHVKPHHDVIITPKKKNVKDLVQPVKIEK